MRCLRVAGIGGRGRGGLGGFGGGRFGGRGGVMATGPSRGEANDYCQHFVDTGQRPQNFLRDSHLVRLLQALHEQDDCGEGTRSAVSASMSRVNGDWIRVQGHVT